MKGTKKKLLDSLIEQGKIQIEKNTYVGLAADGNKVQIGIFGEERIIESYLKAYPTPDKW